MDAEPLLEPAGWAAILVLCRRTTDRTLAFST